MDKDEKRSQYRQLYEASALGLMFPIALGLGFGWGYWMDKIFHTWPWLTAIFTAFGVIAAFINLFRFALRDDAAAGKSDRTSDR